MSAKRTPTPSFLFAGLLLVAALLMLTGGRAGGDALGQIGAGGTLGVGWKAVIRPFGFRDESVTIVGFEPDLAREVAAVLGVKLELVPVVSSNRIPSLLEGKVDLLIATMNDTPERRKVIDIIEPGYYASGVNALAPRSLHLHVWQQLRAKPVCMIEGSFYIGAITDRYQPQVLTFKTTGDMYGSLMREQCRSVIYDDTAIIGQLQ